MSALARGGRASAARRRLLFALSRCSAGKGEEAPRSSATGRLPACATVTQPVLAKAPPIGPSA
ncbi:hypothetical protein GQ55_7G304200 [Panicum hallii var. hallii]|uniref:Uncharacterized protein n=1 Tax=Panicum hallii var. hallii TaxID=1504633 RepID=A0A2T7D0N9_9POAL|nr:hypothetical protein GQ55_7G304200 [Panicum hallii var. hallii]